jgi:hypothetical protein
MGETADNLRINVCNCIAKGSALQEEAKRAKKDEANNKLFLHFLYSFAHFVYS